MIDLTSDGRTAVLGCRGRLDLAGARAIDETVAELLGRGLVSLTVDCSGVDEIDQAGIAGLLRVVACCYDAGLTLHMVGSLATGDITALTGISDHTRPD